jgi:hypothetical protein
MAQGNVLWDEFKKIFMFTDVFWRIKKQKPYRHSRFGGVLKNTEASQSGGLFRCILINK